MGSRYWIFDYEISVFLHGRFLFLECYCLKLQISNVQFLCSAIVKLMEVNQVLLLYETYLYLHTHCYSFSCSCLCLCLRWAMPCPILGHGLFGSTIFILAPRFWRHRQRAFIIILHEYMHLHNAEAARIWSKVGYMQRENIVAAHVHARFLAQEKNSACERQCASCLYTAMPAQGNADVPGSCLHKAYDACRKQCLHKARIHAWIRQPSIRNRTHACIKYGYIASALVLFHQSSPWEASCIVLYCIVLCCFVLYCIVLYWMVLHCIVLYCIALRCCWFHQKWLWRYLLWTNKKRKYIAM